MKRSVWEVLWCLDFYDFLWIFGVDSFWGWVLLHFKFVVFVSSLHYFAIIVKSETYFVKYENLSLIPNTTILEKNTPRLQGFPINAQRNIKSNLSEFSYWSEKIAQKKVVFLLVMLAGSRSFLASRREDYLFSNRNCTQFRVFFLSNLVYFWGRCICTVHIKT